MTRTLILTVALDAAELAADRLWAAGAGAVEERATSDERIELRTVLAADDHVSLARLGDVPGEWSIEFVDVDVEPAETWRDHARPVRVAPDLVLRPAWLPASTLDSDTEHATDVVIEPAASFGLGDHPTTRLTAAAVWRCLRAGDRMLDVGCGSGILAIVAARRGAGHVEAIDIAEAAREATEHNSRLNGVPIHASTTRLADVVGTFDLVAANILAPTLIALSADLRRVTTPGGRLIVSGILADRHEHVIVALAPMRVVRTDELDGWVAVELVAPSASE